MNRNVPPDPAAPVGPSSRRLVLAALLALLLVGAGVGVKVWLGGKSDERKDDPSPEKKRGPVTQQSACSDDDDPKEFEPLDFGKPIEVRFERRLLDALDPGNIPEVERYPAWQPKELVAILGEHRMRGKLFALHPDGKTLAVAAWNDPFIRFGGLDTLHEQFILICPGSARVLEWSPDGTTLAVSCGDGPVRLFDVRDPAKIPRPVTLPRAAQPITSLSFSADGKYLLGGDSKPKDGRAWVWDLKGGKIIKELRHVGPVMSVAFSPVPGDYRALTGGGVEDNKLHLWDALTGKETFIDFWVKKEDSTDYVGQVAFSRDGKRALSCHPHGLVRLWDLANFKLGKETAVLKGHLHCPQAVFSPDGKQVVSGCLRDHGVWLWNALDGKQVRRLGTSAAVHALRFLPEGDRLVFTGTSTQYDANVHVHEVATGKELLPPVGHLAGTTCVALSPEGSIIASGGSDGHLRLWDLDGVKQRHGLASLSIAGVGFQPDGKRVFYWGASWAMLPFVEVASGQNRTPAYKSAHSGAIYSAALTRDGRYAVTGGGDGSVRMWRLADGVEVRHFALGQGLVTVSVAPDMRRALSIGVGKTRLLQLRCGQTVREWDPVAWAPFLADGRAVFFGGAEVPAWKITADKVEEVGRFKLNLAGLSQGQLSADGKRVAAVLNGRVTVFELETGKQLWTWTPPAHFYGVRGVALSPDGGHLLTANGDGTVYVIRLPQASRES